MRRYKLRFGIEVEDLPEDLGGSSSDRTIKTVTFQTQYTLQTEDFTTNELHIDPRDGAGNPVIGGTINMILNAGVMPEGGRLQIYIKGDCNLNPVYGTGVTGILPPGALNTTQGKGTWIGSLYDSADVISWNGGFEYPGDSFDFETVRPVKNIPGETYTVVEEDKYKYLYFTGTAPIINIPTGVFPDSAVLKGITQNKLEIDDSSPNISTSVVDGGTLKIKPLGRFDLEVYPSEGGSHLTGDVIKKHEIHQDTGDGSTQYVYVANGVLTVSATPPA